MSADRRIRVHARLRPTLDLDQLAQAVLLIAEEIAENGQTGTDPGP